jgi:hypothetical protein
MAIFDITTPDGRKFRVEGETQEGALAALQQMLSAQAAPAQPQPAEPQQSAGMMATAADMAKSFAGGLGRGVTSLADTAAAALPVNMAMNAYQMANTAINGGGLLDIASAGMPDPNLRNLASTVTRGAVDYQAQTVPGQYAGTVGEFLPGGVAGKAPMIAGVIPGLASEFAGQLTDGTQLEPFARAAAAIAAPVAGQAVRYPGSVARAMYGTGNPSDERQAFGGLLEGLGVPMTAGQRVGNEATLRREMLTGPGQAIADQQTEAFTRAILGTIGENATRATPAVINDARTRIGQVFDDVARGVDITPDTTMVAGLQDALDTFTRRATSGTPRALPVILEETNSALATGATIPADRLIGWRSDLSALSTNADDAVRESAIAGLKVLDDALEQSLTAAGRADDVARLAEARGQWRNLLAIIKAASGAGSDTAEGLLSPSAIRNAVATQGRSAYATGTRGDIADIARAGESILRRPANSGTPAGLAAYNIPEILSAGTGGAIGSAMDLGALGTAGATVTALLAPALYRRAGMTDFVQNSIINGGPSVLQPKYLTSLSGLLASQP